MVGKSGFLPAKVIHLHPSNLCNLNCKHCYSSSSPFGSDELDIESIFSLLVNLKSSGYEVLSISGGEPLIYKYIVKLIDFASKIDLKVNLITNGMLINKIFEVSSKVSMFAISLDGMNENHDKMRNKQGCFSKLELNIKKLKERAIPFGLVFCVTSENICDLMDIYEFSVKYGAKLLQLHPLVQIGRGKIIDKHCLLPDQLNRLYLTSKLLEQANVDCSLTVQVDLLPKNHIAQARSCYFNAKNSDRISEYVNPIVITEQGELFPYTYGMNKSYSLGNIRQPWDDIVNRYKDDTFFKINDLVTKSFDEFTSSDHKIIDWYYLLTDLSNSNSALPASQKIKN